MDVWLVLAYILLALLVLWFIYNLLGFNKINVRSFGRKQQIVKIILSSSKIRKRKNRTLNILSHLEPLFCIDGEISYDKLVKTITHIKENIAVSQKMTKAQQEWMSTEIDLVCVLVSECHKYIGVRNNLASSLQSLESHVLNGDKQNASFMINEVYKLCVSLERETKYASKKQFWIGLVFGILGISLSLVQVFLKN